MSINWTKTETGFEATVSTGHFRIIRKSGRFHLEYAETERDNNGKHDRVMVGSLTACRQKAEEMVAEREAEMTPTPEPSLPAPEQPRKVITINAAPTEDFAAKVMTGVERRTQPSKAPAYCYPPTLDAFLNHLYSRVI